MTGLFIDTFDLYLRVKRKFGKKLNYEKIVELFGPDELFAYGVSGDKNGGFVSCLRALDFQTRFKKARILRGATLCDWGVGIAVDALTSECDKVVFGTCNLQILPILRYLKTVGVSVTILGVDVPDPLKTLADNVIEITEEMLEE